MGYKTKPVHIMKIKYSDGNNYIIYNNDYDKCVKSLKYAYDYQKADINRYHEYYMVKNRLTVPTVTIMEKNVHPSKAAKRVIKLSAVYGSISPTPEEQQQITYLETRNKILDGFRDNDILLDEAHRIFINELSRLEIEESILKRIVRCAYHCKSFDDFKKKLMNNILK